MSLTRTLTWRAAAAALVVAAGASSCGPNDPTKQQPAKFRLEGSTGQLYDLGYDTARITITVNDFALLFIRNRPLSAKLPDGGTDTSGMTGTSEDYPLKVTFALWGDDLPIRTRVDLSEVDEKRRPRAVVSRDVQSDTRKTYPTVERGTLYFDKALEPNATVKGDLNITFSNGTETASGRTVFGKFEAKVTE